MGVIELLPEAEFGLALQRRQLLVGENDEDLVGGRIQEEAVALGGQPLLQALAVAMAFRLMVWYRSSVKRTSN